MKVVEKGRNAILVCEAEGDPPVNIYWVKDSIRLRRDPRFTVMQQGKLRGERETMFCYCCIIAHNIAFRLFFTNILTQSHEHDITKTQKSQSHESFLQSIIVHMFLHIYYSISFVSIQYYSHVSINKMQKNISQNFVSTSSFRSSLLSVKLITTLYIFMHVMSAV